MSVSEETLVRSVLHDEAVWRSVVDMLCRYRGQRHLGVVTPEAQARLDGTREWRDSLEPEDLQAPWTPRLVLMLSRVGRIVEHYKRWNEPGDPSKPVHVFWWPETLQDAGTTVGEQAFELILSAFRDAGLDQDTLKRAQASWWDHSITDDTEPWNWVSYIEGQRDRYRKRVSWLDSDMPWTPFQVDINSPSLFLDVTSPDVWQVLVDAFRDDEQKADRMWDFLRNMRMASVEYIKGELPGPHADPSRKHDPALPLGYGTSTTMPSFGYRREHRTDHLFVGWAAAHNMDLFNEDLW